MARITPRFLTRTTGDYRHVEEVPATFGPCMAGRRATGEVSFSLTRHGAQGEPRVYVALSYDEAERLGKFAREMRQEKPLTHQMTKRRYLINGMHTATLSGWWHGTEFYPDEDEAPHCPTCSLTAATVAALYMMVRYGLTDCIVQGQRLEWLV